MKRPRWTHVIAVGTVGLMMGGILLGPASAHLNSPLTFKHLRKHFYTKKVAKNLFLLKTGKAADADKIDGVELGDVVAGHAKLTGLYDVPQPIPEHPNPFVAGATIQTLTLPAGNYQVTAKVNLFTDGYAACQLAVGPSTPSRFDYSESTVLNIDLVLIVPANLPSGGTATLACSQPAGDGTWKKVSIVAIEVPTMTITGTS